MSKSAHRAGSEARRQHAVECIRSAAALQVTKHYAARLLAGQPFQLCSAIYTDSAETGSIIGVTCILID